MRVHISALGCKLNQAEAEAWARQLEERGHRVVAKIEEADLHIVNSCAVTREAVRDSDRAVRRGREKERLRTVLTGCAVGGALRERSSTLDVEQVIANADKDRLVELLGAPMPGALTSASTAAAETVATETVATETAAAEGQRVGRAAPFQQPGRRVRVALKIEDGCSMSCAFCIIPGTRGAQRSRPAELVVAELVELEGRGYAEVVITGVQISAYHDRRWQLCDLVERMLAATRRVRLRLTSIAPWQLDERLFDLLRHPRVCRHVHLSLQSGCEATLRRMRRPDRPARFAALVSRLRREVPGIAITSDVIVGFPGEDEAEWRESVSFVREMHFARLHVFRYSERPGTLGAELPDPVPWPVRRERVSQMREVAAEGERVFLEQRIGEVEEVVWERRQRGAWRGTSDNYVRVAVPVEDTGRAVRAGATAAEAPARGAVSAVRIVGRFGSSHALGRLAGAGEVRMC
ncbi:MAG TPA: MiaB/RimO family radical SAM methylthiotransferase [Thermoanaerobaculia bacterium]|nr:MiaB/RimO family radical SAM methylthiotransferase [Thermoanaerobaculia bacterium]